MGICVATFYIFPAWGLRCEMFHERLNRFSMSRLLMRVTLAAPFKVKPVLNLFLSVKLPLIFTVVSLQRKKKSVCHDGKQ